VDQFFAIVSGSLFDIVMDHFPIDDQRRSPHTIKAYLQDLKDFSIWLGETYGESEFGPSSITKRDLIQYRSHLSTVRERKPAGVNRVLSQYRPSVPGQ
jgi:site-specific recombinase XerD